MGRQFWIGLLLAVFMAQQVSPAEPMRQKSTGGPGIEVRELLKSLTYLDGGGNPLKAVPVTSAKPIVLEFWATWCAPCIESMGHLRELATSLGPNFAVFAVTDEPAAAVRTFLARHKVGLTAALDGDGVLFQRFGIVARPTTVVLNANGEPVLIGHPNDLTTDAVRKAVATGKATPSVSFRPAPLISDAGPSIYEVVVRNSTVPEFGVSSAPTGIQMRWHTVAQLFAYAYDTSVYRLKLDTELGAYRYDVKISYPAGNGNPVEILKGALPTALGVRVRPVRQKVACYGLYARGFNQEPSGSPATSISLNADGIRGLGSFSTITRFLEYEVERPVVDHTNLAGNYTIELKWKRGSLESLQDAAVKVGLELVSEEQEVDLVQIDRVQRTGEGAPDSRPTTRSEPR